MQFERTGDPEHPYKLTFEGEEIEIAGAVYREEIFELAKKGNTGSISDFDLVLAGWEEGEARSVRINNYENFAKKFQDFYERTDDAVIDIANESPTPPYLNDDIIGRYEMGKMAIKLAKTIREMAVDIAVDGGVDDAIEKILGSEGQASQPD